MRVISRVLLFPASLLFVAACGTELRTAPEVPVFVVGPPSGCPFPYTGEIASPIPVDNSGDFNLGRTVPVKLRVSACEPGRDVNALTPTFSLLRLDDGANVEMIVSSSAVDQGITLRSAGEGQYLYNLSTKNSRIDATHELTPGRYQLTISSPGDLPDIVVEFELH